MRGFLARSRLSLVLAGVLLVPLAGVASGAGPAAASTTSTKCVAPAQAFSALAGPTFHTCLVDQFGNSYQFTVDSVHHFVYGTATNAQGCSPTWDLTGSYVRKKLELTAANPSGGSDGCVNTYMLKGAYPNAEWYYAFGYGAQGFTYTFCNRPHRPLHVLHGGARP